MLIAHPKNKYDWQHDVLHISLDSQYNSSADEEAPGVYVYRNEDDNHIVGFTILEYSKNRVLAQKMYFHFLLKWI